MFSNTVSNYESLSFELSLSRVATNSSSDNMMVNSLRPHIFFLSETRKKVDDMKRLQVR